MNAKEIEIELVANEIVSRWVHEIRGRLSGALDGDERDVLLNAYFKAHVEEMTILASVSTDAISVLSTFKNIVDELMRLYQKDKGAIPCNSVQFGVIWCNPA